MDILNVSIYDAVHNQKINPDAYLYVKTYDDAYALIEVEKPSILARLELWLRDYRLIGLGREIIRLYKDCYTPDDFCEAIDRLL